jgi:hypothetical protein
MCLVVLGRHVEQLAFLQILLGDRPALTKSETFYQRLLGGETDDLQEQAEGTEIFLLQKPSNLFLCWNRMDAVQLRH